MYLLLSCLKVGEIKKRNYHNFNSIEDMNKFIDGYKNIEKEENGFIKFEVIKKYKIEKEID